MTAASASASRSTRIEALLREGDFGLPDQAAVQYAVEFASQLVSATVPTEEMVERRHAALLGALCRRTQLSANAAGRLLGIVETPEYRARLSATN